MSMASIKRVMVSGAVFIVFAVIGVWLLVFSERITQGEVGVKYSPNGQTEVLDQPKLYFIGIGDKVVTYPTKLQVAETQVVVATSDDKRVTMPVKYEYKVDPTNVMQIFKELGAKDIETVQTSFLDNRITKVVKGVTEDYTILDIRGGKSTEASAIATDEFSKLMENEGFIISDVNLGIPEVDAKTQEAIDLQTQATQNQELKKLELENAKLDAQNKKIVAEGDAEQLLINAKAEAEANRIIQQSISSELLQKEYIEKWDGKESLVKGQGTSAILNLPEATLPAE